MEVRLFGPVAVRRGRDRIPISGKRPALLVRALALEPRAPVSADALVAAGWAERSPANPRKALQTLIVRLLRAVDRDLVVTVPGGYALGPDVTTDVERIDRLVAGVLADAEDPEHLDVLTAVLDEWSGGPFDDLDDWRTAYAVSARIAQQRTTVEDVWLALRLRVEGPTATLGDLEAAVAREPLRESRWVLLAQALRDADRVAGALQALERARHTFAVELGIPPSVRLQELEDDLLLASRPDRPEDAGLRVERHRDHARVALADGDADLAAKELAMAIDEARGAGRPAALLVDLHLALAAAYRRAGAAPAAQTVLEEAADLARLSGDAGRLGEVAIAGSGDAWQTTLDATASAIPLLKEALEALPSAPTPLRARLLARYAVAASHVEPPAVIGRILADAAEIAAILDDADTTAAVLIAETEHDQDPRRRPERRACIERLLELADRNQQPQWRSAVVPSLARLTAQEGDVDGALCLLDEVAAYGEASGDAVAAAAVGSRACLHATVSGDFAAVLAAIDTTARGYESAMPDPSGSAVMRWALTGVATLVYDRLETAPAQVMPFPQTSMDALMTAYVAAALGACGRRDEGLAILRRLDPEEIAGLPHDFYWLSLLWAVGRAVWELGDQERAAALHECCLPFVDLLVVDGGFLFLGAVAHHAGLGAAVAGRTAAARELLTDALARHRRIGSPWWTQQSEESLTRMDS